jgi:tRNA-binding protein
VSTDPADAISFTEFTRVDLRIGTVTSARPNVKARKPAFILTVDLGPLGSKTSSAQITEHYTVEELVGRQVLCVCNFEPKRIAGVKSEVLVVGGLDRDGHVVLAGFGHPVPNGTPLR